MSKTKILIVTDSGAIHTGLGETCRLVFSDLLARYPDKYEVHQLGWFHANAAERVPWPIYNTNINNTPTGPQLDMEDRYGQRSFEGVLAKVKPDIVWTNGDLWCFEHMLNSPNRNSFRLIAYYTIDGSPYVGTWLTPSSSDWGSKLVKADRLVTLTEYGAKVLSTGCPELKGKKIDVVYHPMDVPRFRHLDSAKRTEERSRIYPVNVPRDAFVMGWVGRNQFRKQNHKMWETLGYVRHGHYIECSDCSRVTIKEYDWCTQRPINGRHIYEEGYDYSSCWYCKSQNITPGKPLNDVYLWQHMSKTDPGYNFGLHSKLWNIEDRVIVSGADTPTRGLDPKVLADLMSTWNCLLYLTGGEGFGVPAFESLMCGVPVIYANYSSHADFCKHGGLPVRVGQFVPEFAFGINRSVVDTGDAVKQILWAYRNQDKLWELGKKGRMFALTKNLTSTVDQWHTMFTDMMNKPVARAGTGNIYSQVV